MVESFTQFIYKIQAHPIFENYQGICAYLIPIVVSLSCFLINDFPYRVGRAFKRVHRTARSEPSWKQVSLTMIPILILLYYSFSTKDIIYVISLCSSIFLLIYCVAVNRGAIFILYPFSSVLICLFSSNFSYIYMFIVIGILLSIIDFPGEKYIITIINKVSLIIFIFVIPALVDYRIPDDIQLLGAYIGIGSSFIGQIFEILLQEEN